MLYWFFVKGLGGLARHRFHPVVIGTDNIPKQGGAIIAANHLAVIDDAVIPITCPRMVHFMGKSDYFTGKGFKGWFKKWWFTSVGVFPVDRAGGDKAAGAMATAREILESGELFGIHPEGTRSPDGRLYRAHTGFARLALETGCPIIPTALIGTREIQKPGQVMPGKGTVTVVYDAPIQVEKKPEEEITREDIRALADELMERIQKLTGQEYVDMYAQEAKKLLAARVAE
ncbi:1-acyl-sn-glycerol-3-phosphate acyltransferase [Alloscardovia macacae]|uniref:1-acyl-sn-glycerol-3-phosphate acyltransferase n=1 Tax=Alloscardovia macacae TaxID=1160091 RepID=A0A1Y2SYM4_9BIFI|nr:lysophospholipid acyltransferase family protein [Alloscardovia macacae]OTA27640.1 1-acyl-sn-glycerol-3-phosphate acyltransferase [Alloscardovia macacae]OTA30286.1 1-acyl-sn-glycerol-3-phosphate acyltransferase [Alloscardovia macacae]